MNDWSIFPFGFSCSYRNETKGDRYWQNRFFSFCSFFAYVEVKTGLRVELWLGEWWWASEWAIVAVITAQLCSQRVFLLVISSKNKNKPREKRRLHYCLHSSTVFTMATGQRLSTIHKLLPPCSHIPSYTLFARVKATLHWRSNIRAQVQSYNIFWNVLGRAAVFWTQRHLTVLNKLRAAVTQQYSLIWDLQLPRKWVFPRKSFILKKVT